MEAQLIAQAEAQPVEPESLSAILAALPLAIAADGVMVPFHPVANTPKGKTKWQEIKIAILARLGTRLNRAGELVPQLLNRRLVAVLGDIDHFISSLQLEARRQDFESAQQVVGSVMADAVSGAFIILALLAVLDFFHAAGHHGQWLLMLCLNPLALLLLELGLAAGGINFDMDKIAKC